MDGVTEVTMTSEDGLIHALAADGSLLWQFDTNGGSGIGSPTVADLDGDAKKETIVQVSTGDVVALSDGGQLIWSYRPPASGKRTPGVGNIMGDAKLEIIGTSGRRIAFAIDADGNELWSYLDPRHLQAFTSPALADIDSDGYDEVIAASRYSNVFALDGDGSLLWEYFTGDWIDSPPAIGDLTGDGDYEVVVASTDTKVYVLNGLDGSLEWSYTTSYWAYYVALGDLDGDGELEIVTRTYDDLVYALDADGTLLWTYPAGFTESAPVLGDVDGDGALEVVFGSAEGQTYQLHAVNADGTSATHWPMELESRPYTAAIADLDDNGVVEVLVGTEDGKVHAWTMETPATGVPGWYVEGQNMRRTRAVESPETVSAPIHPTPSALALSVAPSPARLGGTVQVGFSLPQDGAVTCQVFDLAGRVIRTLVSGSGTAGEGLVPWDTTDDRGRSVGRGVYFVRVSIGHESATQRVVIL